MSEKSLRNINNRNHTLSLHRTQKLLESILVYVLRQERCVDAASRDIIRYKHKKHSGCYHGDIDRTLHLYF